MTAAVSTLMPRAMMTFAEARRIASECEDKYQRGSERYALASTVISLYLARDVAAENDADQQEEIERLRAQVAALQGVAR